MNEIESAIDFTGVEERMRRAVAERVFPGAVLRVQWQGKALFHRAFGVTHSRSGKPVTVDTVFDLASLTKPLATALAVMILVQDGRLALEDPLGTLLPELLGTSKERIHIKHLLLHTSGLPDHRPYYRQLPAAPCEDRRAQLNRLLVAEPLVNPIGERCVYSDIGFMLLRWVVETVSGQRLDRFVHERVYQPLGISSLFFLPADGEKKDRDIAAAQWCSWRGRIVAGQVGDENAFAAGGVDGHAGLFGTAGGVGDLVAELMSVYRGRNGGGIFQQKWIRRFLSRDEASDRTLGFDMPTPGASGSGNYFSDETVGHLGYTGTSFWADLKRDISVVLLTNRVHPSTENTLIRAFRPAIHDAVMASVLQDRMP